jgi:hypothetical protein
MRLPVRRFFMSAAWRKWVDAGLCNLHIRIILPVMGNHETSCEQAVH